MLRIQPPTRTSLSRYFSRSVKSSFTVVNCMIFLLLRSAIAPADPKRSMPPAAHRRLMSVYRILGGDSRGRGRKSGLFHELFMSRSNLCNLIILSLTSFLVNRSRKKTQTSPISLYKAFFQRYSLYRVNTDWLCPETHTVPAKRHCHKSSPSFLS